MNIGKVQWFDLANLVLPIIALTVPAARPLIPYIQNGIFQAQQLHGDSDNAAKKALVLDAVQAVVATGKVTINVDSALRVTNAAFDAIDGIQKIIKENQTIPVPPVIGG